MNININVVAEIGTLIGSLEYFMTLGNKNNNKKPPEGSWIYFREMQADHVICSAVTSTKLTLCCII